MTPILAAQALRGILDLDTVRLSTRERRMAEQAIKVLLEAGKQQPQPTAEPPIPDVNAV